jgi:hypothetical protein
MMIDIIRPPAQPVFNLPAAALVRNFVRFASFTAQQSFTRLRCAAKWLTLPDASTPVIRASA